MTAVTVVMTVVIVILLVVKQELFIVSCVCVFQFS